MSNWVMKRFVAILVMAWCYAAFLFSQGVIDSAGHRLSEQLRLFPQEKVSLHVDRTVLMPGDTIRLKVYVTDAATLRPLLDDQFAYVELLNEQNRSLQRKRLISSNNLYTGYLVLAPDQPPGVYHLWAYTLYSSQVKDYDCLLPIQVGSERPKLAAPKKSEPVLRFFPEGGNIVEGTTCMVGFEATTAAGDTLDVEGDVVDGQGHVVCQFKTFHRGLGFFPLKAEKGQQYTAECRDRSGRKYRFALPLAQAEAVSLRCRVKTDEVQVIANVGDSWTGKSLYLLVHCRGQMVSLHPLRAGIAYHLPLSLLPAGVNSLLLLDDEGHVLSERLVFSNNGEQRLPLTIGTPSLNYGLRDSISLNLALSDMADDELAFVSLSATDDGITQGRCSPSLWCQLLLSSDLNGLHNELDDYFQPVYQADKLDLLMMICGWRRYDIGAALQGNYAMPTVQKEQEQSVSGRVRAVFANKPVGEAQVVLAIPKQSHLDMTMTDSTGHFEFHGLNYPEDVELLIYAQRQKNRRCLVETDKPYQPYTPAAGQIGSSVRMLPWMEIDSCRLEQYARDSYLLQEVVVKGHNKSGAFYDNTTLTLDRQQIEEGEYPNLGFLLMCTNMLWVDYASGNINADPAYSSSINRLLRSRENDQTEEMDNGGETVALYVNGMNVPGITFNDIEIDDIERLDVYLGAKAWVFGIDSISGVVNVTTRNSVNRSTDNIFNNKIVKLTGYQEPVEYYFPRYQDGDQPSQIQPDVRRTLYWNPYLRMVKDTPINLSFYSADLPTTYTIRAEGITSQGRIVSGKLQIQVTE